MNCPNCSAEAGPDQKFCFECGSGLGSECTNCGSPLPPGARFCGECGTAVATRADTPAGAGFEAVSERRLVSVLFADLVGFTSTSEERDPEEVKDFLNRYTELASETIARYGGTVDKFIGDGVMAIWGTPTAHEDDAERAVRAALDLTADVEALGKEFGVPDLLMRAGVTTGQAAVTVEGGSHGMVAGDLVNTASRLEGAATPGSTLVDDATKRATDRAVSYEDAGSLALKGKAHEVSVWRPLGIVAKRGGAGRIAGLEPPFVGRDSELHLVKELFKATARDSRAHLVSIQGIPGIGKSRLVWEFEKYLDGMADSYYWHQGRAPAYGDGVTFWSLGEMVRRRAGIVEGDEEATTLSRVGACVEEHIPLEDQAWVAGALHTLLGVGSPESMDRDELFAAWRSFFQRMALDQPVLMVFEDLQWADHGTIDFVESLLEWSRDYAIFIVTLSRPELLDRRENWGAGQRGFTGLHMEALSPAEVDSLLDGMVPGLPEPLKTQIIQRSEGVPLYAVETVRMLVGAGHLMPDGEAYVLHGEAPELAVPETLHALVAARLDALGSEDRHLLQMASVLGQTFSVKALADLAELSPGEIETRLEPMMRREILAIEADPRSPERGQYRFVQGVIKEVAYSSIGKTERSALHVRVAELMAGLGDEELAGVIASHYMDAYNSLNERDRDESLRQRALASVTDAGERAAGLGSNAQALAFFEQALGIADHPFQLAQLENRAGESAILSANPPAAETHFARARAAAAEVEDESLWLTSTVNLANALLMSSRVGEAVGMLEEAAQRDTGRVTPGWVAAHAQHARAYAFLGDGARANELIDKALKEAATLGLTQVLVDSLITKGWALSLADRTLEGLVVTEGALASADRHGLHREAMRARNNMAAYLGWDDPAWTLDVAMIGYEQATHLGNLDDRANLGVKAIWSAQELGDLPTADRIIGELEDSTLPFFALNQLRPSIAIAEGFGGRVEEALRLLDEAEKHLEGSTSAQDSVEVRDRRAWVLLMADRPREALECALSIFDLPIRQWDAVATITACHAALWAGDEAALQGLLERAEDMGYVSDRWQANIGLARAAIDALGGDTEAALERFRGAEHGFRSLKLKPDLALCLTERLMCLGPDHEGAAEAASNARDIWTELGMVPYLAKLNSIYSPR